MPPNAPVAAGPLPGALTPFPAGTGGSRKKRLYVKLQPVDAAETAVLELRLSSRSKVLPLHEKIG